MVKILPLSAVAFGTAYAALNLNTLFDNCLESDLTSTVLPNTDNLDINCIENPPLRQFQTESNRTTFMRCEIKCQHGYRMNDPNNVNSIPDFGTFSCNHISQNNPLKFWKYTDKVGSTSNDDFSGCVATDCTPATALLKQNTKRFPDVLSSYATSWRIPLDSVAYQENGVDQQKVSNTLKLVLYPPEINYHMPSADWNLGFTIIVTMVKPIKGRFYVNGAKNWNAHPNGKTFSFSSQFYNRDQIDDTGMTRYTPADRDAVTGLFTPTVADDRKSQGYSFSITFTASDGEQLPFDPALKTQVESVKILNGEFSNTECLTSTAYTSLADNDGLYASDGSAFAKDVSITYDFKAESEC